MLSKRGFRNTFVQGVFLLNRESPSRAAASFAQFIGSPAMNVFEGILKDDAVEALGARWPLPDSARGTHGQAVMYGIRPVHIDLAASGIPAEVIVVEPMGAETELLVKINDIVFTVVAHGRSSAGPGDAIRLAPRAAHAHVFDAASGSRL